MSFQTEVGGSEPEFSSDEEENEYEMCDIDLYDIISRPNPLLKKEQRGEFEVRTAINMRFK